MAAEIAEIPLNHSTAQCPGLLQETLHVTTRPTLLHRPLYNFSNSLNPPQLSRYVVNLVGVPSRLVLTGEGKSVVEAVVESERHNKGNQLRPSNTRTPPLSFVPGPHLLALPNQHNTIDKTASP